jgi:hypothetical protein
MPDLVIAAPNGVAWRRQPGGTSSGAEFLEALEAFTGFWGDAAVQWNWWQEGRRDHEHDRIMKVIRDWDHAAPPPGGYLTTEEATAKLDAEHASRERHRQERAACYDKDVAAARLRMLQAEATAGFMRNVLAAPASPEQEAKAGELLAGSTAEAATLREQVGDPDVVTDDRGDLPPARRERHLHEHMAYFRHAMLREWSSGQRQRFRQLLAMPLPRPADMCSECQAPAAWHNYATSLRLWRGKPEPGSAAARIATLMPGWWERCPACTPYQLHHQWGGHDSLPGFGHEQWHAMLTPVLRAVFAPGIPVPRKPADPRQALTRRLRAAERDAERLRRQLAELPPQDRS